MTKHPGKPPKQVLTPDGVSDFLRQFVDAEGGKSEAMVDNLVRVRVGPAMNLESVEILGSTLDPEAKRRLETAIVGAVNTAMQRATVSASVALRDYARQRTAEKGEA